MTEEARRGLRIRARTLVGPCDPSLTVGSPGGWTNVPLHKDLLQAFRAAAEVGIQELDLLYADLHTRHGLALAPERRRSGLALVHVATAAGIGGALRYEAQAYNEAVERYQVVRKYQPFPPAGVAVVATGMGPGGETEPHGLVVMAPKSSFRLVRTGELEGASPVLIVKWTGSRLYCDPPRWVQQRQAS